MLTDLGHEVIATARNGEDAIEQYAAHQPDLVTMDITMPDIDGVEATKRIMEQNANALIIMITSHGQEAMVLDSIEAGAKGYLLKPLKPDKLKETIEEAYQKYGEGK